MGTTILMAIAILLGIAGSIILVLGVINKKNVMIISAGIMLLFTVLFCTGAIFCSACHMHRHHKHHEGMMPPMFMHWQENKYDDHMNMSDCKKHSCDSICNKKEMKKDCPKK